MDLDKATFDLSDARVESNTPVNFRLCIRHANTSQPTYVLQGCYKWQQGMSGGFEWRDIPYHYEN